MTTADPAEVITVPTVDVSVDIVDFDGPLSAGALEWLAGAGAGHESVSLWRGVSDDAGPIGEDRSRVIIHRPTAGDLVDTSGGRHAAVTRIHRYLAKDLLALRSPGRPDPSTGQGFRWVAMNCQDEALDDFNAWYEQEHLPAFASVPGVLEGRRLIDPTASRRYQAAYWLESVEVLEDPRWPAAAKTEWTARVRPFTGDRDRLNGVPLELP